VFLEHIKAVATGCNVPEVVLLRVVEPLSANTVASLAEVGSDLITRIENENKAQAKDYISKMEGICHTNK
jgi:hypothetical protein